MIRKLLEKLRNRGSQNLSTELLKLVKPCDGCGQMPIVNPKWLIKGNSCFLKKHKYILGCPSTMWGSASGWETIEAAIENWNHHVGFGTHKCYVK
jgi:hypothetical protein